MNRVSLVVAFGMTSQGAFAAPGPVGHFRLSAGPDIASELVVSPDGTFEYFMAAGSLDEQSRGTWLVEGNSLRLRTTPRPVPAVFSEAPASSTSDGIFSLHVTDPSGHGIAAVDFTLGFDAGPPIQDYTQDYGWSLDNPDKRIPRWVEFTLPIYQLRSQRFVIDARKGNRLTYILTPNDLGTIDFTGVQIDVRPRELVVHRWGELMSYENQPEN